MSLVPPARSIRRKSSGFLKFWKKPRSADVQILESDIILPTEIWLDILALLPGYLLDPLSRVFPFVETFAFRRRNVSAELTGYEERSLERLNFLSTERLTYAVRELFISPYPPGYNRRHKAQHTAIDKVMRELLAILPQFHNLKNLVLRFPECNGTLLTALGSMCLDSFELELLPTSSGEILIPAQRDFIFNASSSPIQGFLSPQLYLRFLYPASLQSIVAGPTGSDTVARALLSTPSGLPALTKLDVSLRFAGHSQFTEALLACPNLSSLRLRSSVLDGSTVPAALAPLPQTAVPHLQCYHGPAVFVPTFARGRALRHVRLWSSHSVSSVTAPWLLQPILLQLASPSIESLELGVTVVPDSLLETIRDAFPALTTLALNAHLDAFHPGSVARRTLPDSEPPAPTVRLTLPVGLRLHILRLGAQLEGALTAPEAIRESARAAVHAFPGNYDPTSWRRWVVDRPWYCLEWMHAPDAGAEFGMALHGTLRVEYGEHYFESFERGQRISSRTIQEAVQRMA
ncbi:hypothetical protein C8R46DRAFT_1342638 [Mycena filopes]|nr:hypothetical protein C8R46DRAFT_1342638 [Mycena filopes]